MSKHPAATREDHDDFCVAEKWQLVRGASGQPVRHHRTYELALWDGQILRTRISRPVDKSTYSAGMWTHNLRTQLAVDAEAFWACLRDKKLPDRGTPETVTQKEPLPLYLVRALNELGVDESESLALTAAEAAQLLSEKIAERYGHQSSS